MGSNDSKPLNINTALVFEYQPRWFTPRFVKRFIEKEWGVNTPFQRHRFLRCIFYKRVCLGIMRDVRKERR